MKIYTGFGDKGQTSLWGGETVSKNDPRVMAYGALDELNSQIGLIRAYKLPAQIDSSLQQRQNEIFNLSAEIAASGIKVADNLNDRIGTAQIDLLEQEMDQWTQQLPELKRFILPGGNLPAATAHIARTVCRRAEREIITIGNKENISQMILVYINRLSDWLFTLARLLNFQAEIEDTFWETVRK